jgi:hypothetical protein
MNDLYVALIFFVITTISIVPIYNALKEDKPSKKNKKLFTLLAIFPAFQAIHVILHLFGVFPG